MKEVLIGSDTFQQTFRPKAGKIALW